MQVFRPSRKTGGNIYKITGRIDMRYLLRFSFLTVMLAACSQTIPNDGPEYFDSITPDPASLERKAQEDRLLQAEGLAVTVRPPAEGTVSSDATVMPANRSAETNTVPLSDGTISNSQDFQTAKANDTIASDAAKLQQLKDNYQIIQPGAAPVRVSDINLAKYALAQTNPVGQKTYNRFSVGGAKAKRKCERYISADEAQLDFLKSGGPEKDRNGIDPDGDGYACNWSPDVFRAMIGQ
jgi:hypothetical protein